jgi:hypothetical protein
MELPRRLLVGEIGLLGDDLPDELLLPGGDPRRVSTAVRPRLEGAGLALQPLPAVDRRLADLEQLRGLLVSEAASLQRGDHALTQVDRVPLRHPPPSLERPGGSRSERRDPIK